MLYTLHPNMFLLNLTATAITADGLMALHPNMFLLNRRAGLKIIPAVGCFTSQYVSIKSAHCHSYYLHIPPLHPNMFLLNHSFQHATTHS